MSWKFRSRIEGHGLARRLTARPCCLINWAPTEALFEYLSEILDTQSHATRVAESFLLFPSGSMISI